MAKGRPREFNTEQALDAAVMAFWRQGYQATSLSDLSNAMSINRPSMYAAFGDKEQLFLKALERYQQTIAGPLSATLQEDVDTKSAISCLLQRTAEIHTDTALPRGCFIVNSTLECCGWSDTLEQKLAEHHALTEAAIYERLQKGQLEGEIAPDRDVHAMAQFYNGVMQGMAVLAKVQPNPIMIRNIAETAMRVW